MNHEAKATINLAYGWRMVVPTNKLVAQSTQLSESKVEAFRSMLREGSRQPPLLVNPPENGMYEIRDGAHRYRARVEEGIDMAEVIVVGSGAVTRPQVQELEKIYEADLSASSFPTD